MKKKLLVTTAALAVSLTSLAPIMPLAETQGKTESTVGTMASIERKHRVAEHHARVHGDQVLNDLKNKLNNGQKLGYLKGSKVTFKLDNVEKDIDMYTSGDSDIYLKGKSYIKNLTLKDVEPSLGVSYDPSTKAVTIERLKNKKSNGLMSIAPSMGYNYQTWSWYGAWYRENDISSKSDYIGEWNDMIFTNFEEAPKLGVDPHRHIPTLKAMDIDKLNPKDYYDLTSHAGEVKSEFVKKPDPNIIGEQTATIRVWDEYGEETPSDQNHNKTFDVKFNVKDSNNWETEDLHGWRFVPFEETSVKRVKEPGNSLTGDYAMYSTGYMNAYKKYHLEPGATYKFTTFIKPEHVNQDDLILLSLTGDEEQRVLFGASPDTLPSVEKGFKKLSQEFTVKSGEENPELFFMFRTNQGFFIDSFELERVK